MLIRSKPKINSWNENSKIQLYGTKVIEVLENRAYIGEEGIWLV